MGNNFTIDKSFQLIRTNPALTTNVQLVVSNDYTLYLESFDSNKELSDDIYKHHMISKETYYEDKVAEFYKDLPLGFAFDVKDDNDKSVMSNTYVNQFDDIYWSGSKKTQQNSFYKEEFEYLAPLYIKNHKIPSNFVIMRCDDFGIFSPYQDDYAIDIVTRQNFKAEIINKWKCVSVFDMTIQSNLGYWINNNFVDNDRFPNAPLEFDSKSYNLSRWYGINYFSGVYTDKGQYLTDKLWYEQPHYMLEDFIVNSYKENELIFPNIINFKFLFDDTPATPYLLNKYSINRYYGFYVDMELVKSLTPYRQKTLRTDLKIDKNIFMLSTQYTGSCMPFTDDWNDNIRYYVYAKNELCQVIKSTENGVDYYKIISKDNLIISDINRNYEIDINFDESGSEYRNYIKPRILSYLDIDIIIKPDSIDDLYADLYLIKINDKYHVLEFEFDDFGNKNFYIRTDYGIECDDSKLTYWINGKTSEYSTTVNVEDNINTAAPILFEIYRAKFYDIKDFDYTRVDSHYADFDFDKKGVYVDTSEHKLYAIEYKDASEDVVFKTYPDDSLYAKKIMNVSSEYISSDELFEINKDGLTDIWHKNQYIPKWGFSGSISHADYPYKLNNSNKVGSTFNKTTDVFSISPNIVSKTNDFFYRIGNYNSASTNVYYDIQSLSIETETYNTTYFDLDKYINSNFDYFDYFFKNTRYVNNNLDIEQTTHYSMFVDAASFDCSTTLFKGIRLNIYKVNDIVRNSDGLINNIITENNLYNNYKFSIITNFLYSSTTTATTQVESSIVNLNSSGIHIFLNDKFKNCLILVNVIVDAVSSITFNDISHYDPKEGIYTSKTKLLESTLDYNPALLTASNFIGALNNLNDKYGFDNYITYYYINENGQTGYTMANTGITGNMTDILGKKSTPFIISTEMPNKLTMKKTSFLVAAIKGPKFNIYDKFKIDYTETVYDKSFIKDPLARYIRIDEDALKPRPVGYGETQVYDKTIYRYNGAYEPIFKDVELFKNLQYYSNTGSFIKGNYAGNYDELYGIFNTISSEYSSEQIEYLLSLYSDKKSNYQILSDKIVIILSNLTNDKYYYTNIKLDSKQLVNIDTQILYYTGLKSTYDDLISKYTASINYLLGISPTINTLPIWQLKEYSLGECNDNYTYCSLVLTGTTTGTTLSGLTDILYLNTFNFQIPTQSVIVGIKIDIGKKVSNSSGSTITATDNIIQLMKIDGEESLNHSSSTAWSTTLSTSSYGGSTDLWGFSSLTYQDVNNNSFSVMIQSKLITDADIINTVYIDCVKMTIYYNINGISVGSSFDTYIDRNYIFDTTLSTFGMISELVYSKVNPNENILKIQNTEEDKSIYVMVDEYGYSYADRFIFKSTFDNDYYLKTTNTTE